MEFCVVVYTLDLCKLKEFKHLEVQSEYIDECLRNNFHSFVFIIGLINSQVDCEEVYGWPEVKQKRNENEYEYGEKVYWPELIHEMSYTFCHVDRLVDILWEYMKQVIEVSLLILPVSSENPIGL